ncbi:protein RALF-like 19 [Sesamum indicum]|uniref:Protein RALF-like 19 n=1 Tax=Sesamum indicum TaxID=4182 RepID=A0A6I9TQ65_SESIN|nr:protein RALF-like 19 [Sesamum indicum]
MAFRGMGLLILLLSIAALATVAQPTQYTIDLGLTGEPDGHGLMAAALEDQEFMMESETARRQLWNGGEGYVGYRSLGKNNLPCSRRGVSYYNCNGNQRANVYNRGCTRATRCARRTR